nr:uncharacterized protein LOC109154222 [Ipomoea batatas]
MEITKEAIANAFNNNSSNSSISDDVNEELVFNDGDELTWGDIAKCSGANETPYSIRHTSKGNW